MIDMDITVRVICSVALVAALYCVIGLVTEFFYPILSWGKKWEWDWWRYTASVVIGVWVGTDIYILATQPDALETAIGFASMFAWPILILGAIGVVATILTYWRNRKTIEENDR